MFLQQRELNPSILPHWWPLSHQGGPTPSCCASLLFYTFSPHQQASFLHWAAFTLRRQIQVGTTVDQRPRSFHWPTCTWSNFSLVAEISYRSLEVDRCHLLIFSHRFSDQASGGKASSQEVICPPGFSNEGCSTLWSSLTNDPDHIKGGPPLVVTHLSSFSTFILINGLDLCIGQHAWGIDGGWPMWKTKKPGQ